MGKKTMKNSSNDKLRQRGVSLKDGGTTNDKDKEEKDAADSIPEDVRVVKEKLEAKTGKKYAYREPMPGVAELLRRGSAGPTTWKQTIFYPVLVALVFGISLLMFHHLVLTKPPGRPAYTIPKR
jgi:hypothetical protein